MVHLEKFVIEEVRSSDRKNPKRLKKYLHTCDKCKAERGYFIKTFDKATKNGGLCRSCSALLLGSKSEMTRKRISETRIQRFKEGTLVPTMLGVNHSNEAKEKMRIAAKSRIPATGWKHSDQAKIKMSCARRNISLNDFDGFITSQDEVERTLFKSLGLHWKCFERFNYQCDCCSRPRSTDLGLHAHHLDSWNWAIDKRFEESNLVTLCYNCHNEFHSIFGRGNNTKTQYEEFKWQKHLLKSQKLNS